MSRSNAFSPPFRSSISYCSSTPFRKSVSCRSYFLYFLGRQPQRPELVTETKVRPLRQVIAVLIALLVLAPATSAQSPAARITEETRSILTYPFSEPNPVPILVRDARLYPYHAFTGYSAEGTLTDWKVIKLENDYIEVYVLPDAGGKVWGAIEKSTGNEFIYRNEVMKFRNIALRGPWTSGGIEFNFGVIGHTPATATPVDYRIIENDDGSVSTVVGAMDLPSRTVWRVEIRLPADAAYFETRALWTNPTPSTQAYYNWMTGAAFARKDLIMSIPGNAYLKHSGDAMSWPYDDEGRYLPRYDNNTFDGHKSYHVVGEYNDFFGGYYTDLGVGFGHWARYEDLPGQKLWLWALSREGGIWEDLLTDTDGQYVEFQAGRLFVQYSPGAHVNPITQAEFEPNRTDRWTETWFPLKGIGGLNDASMRGAMYVHREGNTVKIGVNAFEAVAGTLMVRAGDTLLLSEPLSLDPMEVLERSVVLPPSAANDAVEVKLPALGLDYRSDPEVRRLHRSFETDPAVPTEISETRQLLVDGRELMKARRLAGAALRFKQVLKTDPWNREALLRLADLHYRSGRYEGSLILARRALELDAYDAEANFLAGTIYRAAGALTDAREAFGWAARSMTYRAAGETQLADIALIERRFGDAGTHAQTALDYDRYNLRALEDLAVAYRKTGDPDRAVDARERLLEIDPIHHFAFMERYLESGDRTDLEEFDRYNRSEYPDQILLELAIGYLNLGMNRDAVAVLATAPESVRTPLLDLWQAWLDRSEDPASAGTLLANAATRSIERVFPYRRETLDVLEWTIEQDPRWQWKYQLALNYWAKQRTEEAADLMAALGDTPDYAPFYVARAALMRQVGDRDEENDLRRAFTLNPQTRIIRQVLIQYYQRENRWEDALALTADYRKNIGTDFNNELQHARSLIYLNRPQGAIDILDRTRVLPSEGARDSHRLYAWAHTRRALNDMRSGNWARALDTAQKGLAWPEHLGQGRPYDPDERLLEYIVAESLSKLERNTEAREAFARVADFTDRHGNGRSIPDILGYFAFLQLGDEAAARQLIEKITVDSDFSEDDAPPMPQWIRLRAMGKFQKAGALVSNHPQVFDTLDFRLVREVLETAER